MENEVLDYVMNTPGNTNPAILNQMLDEVSGTKLPEPTAQDNGKVLGVADGAYALVSGGGGSEPLIVHWDSEKTGIDVSYSEIKTALLAGKTIYLVDETPFYELYMPLANISLEEEVYFAAFSDGTNTLLFSAEDAATDMANHE